MNISGYFSKHEISEELIIPFASSKPAILMVAGSDDQLCPSVYFVSTIQFFWKCQTILNINCQIKNNSNATSFLRLIRVLPYLK